MGLFGPAWKTKNERKLDKANAAVDAAERRDLPSIALQAPLLKVRLHACERLGGDEDLESLITIARMADSDTVKNKAIERIVDTTSTTLYELAGMHHGRDNEMRAALIEYPQVSAVVLALVSNWNMDRNVQERATRLFEKRLEDMGKAELMALFCNKPSLGRVSRSNAEKAWKRLESVLSEDELLKMVQEHPQAIATDIAWSTYADKLPGEKLFDLALDEGHPYCVSAKHKLHRVLSGDELLAMAKERGIREGQLCDRILHHRDNRCCCVWCGRQLNHYFDERKMLREGDACVYCGAKVTGIDISRNPFTDEMTRTIIVEYEDGTTDMMED